MKRENNVDRQVSILTIITLQESQMSIRDRFSYLLKGLIRLKGKNGLGHQRETKLSNAATENRAYKSTLHIVITPSECSLSKEH